MAPAVPWAVRTDPGIRPSPGPIIPSRYPFRTSSFLPQPPKPCNIAHLPHNASRLSGLLVSRSVDSIGCYNRIHGGDAPPSSIAPPEYSGRGLLTAPWYMHPTIRNEASGG